MRPWFSWLLLAASLSSACDATNGAPRHGTGRIGAALTLDGGSIDSGVLAPDAAPIAASATSLDASPTPSVYGQSVTFTARVTGAAGTPGGSVTFLDGTTSLGTSALDGAGKATFSTSLLAAGAHQVTAIYGGSALYEPSTSPAASEVVRNAGTTTAVSSSATPAVVGDAVTFTAKVARLGAFAGAPTGTVSFTDGAATLGNAAVGASGVATFIAPNLALGAHSIIAAYGGDTNFDASASPALSQAVNQDGVTVTLGASPNPSTYRANVSFAATVTAEGATSGAPGGTVTFKEGATLLGTVPLDANGVAAFASGALLGGSHTVMAAYSGDTNHAAASGSVMEVVGRATSSTGLVSAANPAVSGQSVTLTATVSGSGVTPGGSLVFLDGAVALGTSSFGTAGQATLTLSNLAPGTHTLTAKYAGDGNYQTSTSPAVSEQINLDATTTTVVSSSTPSTVGGLVTFTATVTPLAPGTGVPTGVVAFRDGTTTLGIPTVNKAGVATLSTRALSVQTHAISAEYGGEVRFLASASPGLSQVVTADGASVSLVPSANPSIFGDAVSFTATVTSAGTGGVPTGSVTFKDGTGVLATTALSAGSAVFTSDTLAGGPHTLSATYGGDTNHAGTFIGTVVQSVDPAPTTLTVTSSANPSVLGQSIVLTATATTLPVAPFAGTVTFLDGAALLGTSSIDATGKATLSVASLGITTHSIQVVYGGDISHAASTSAPLSEVVGADTTKTALASSSNPAAVGKSVTFTATVSPVAPGVGVATGMITFSDGKTMLGGSVLDEHGVATFETGTLTEGQHSITAAYGGDGSYAPSTSAALAETLAVQVTTVVLAASPSPSVFGARVSLTATVNGSLTTPTGKVTFRDGTTSLGDVALDASGTAALSTTTLGVGTHTLGAEYDGDDANAAGSGTVSEAVNAADTTTTLTAGENPSVTGDRVTFTVTVTSSAAGVAGDVELFDGTTSLGVASLRGATAAFHRTGLTVGGHVLTAVYKGNASFAPSTSSALTEVVIPPDTAKAGDAGTVVDAGSALTQAHDGGGVRASDASISVVSPLNAGGGGCGCHTTPRAPPNSTGLFGLLGVAVLVTRRRFKRAAPRSRRAPAPSRRSSGA